MSYRLVATTCKDGDCPSLHRDGEGEGADWIVRSRDAKDPRRERDVRFTAQEWATLHAHL